MEHFFTVTIPLGFVNVCVLTPLPTPKNKTKGGVSVVGKNLLEGFSQINKNARIIAITFDEAVSDRRGFYTEILFDTKVYILKSINFRNLACSIRLISTILAREKIDIIHTQDTEMYGALSTLFKTKNIVTIHGLIKAEILNHTQYPGLRGKLRRSFRYLIDKYVLFKTKHVIIINRYIEERLQKELRRKTLYRINNPISQSFFDAKKNRGEIKSLTKGSNVNILWIGTAYPRKGLHLLINAYQHFIKKTTIPKDLLEKITVHVVGRPKDQASQNYYDACKKYLFENQLIKNFEFYQNLPDDVLLNLMNTCNLLLITAKEENSPMIIIESLLTENEIIASEVGGISSILPNLNDFPIKLYEYGNINQLNSYLDFSVVKIFLQREKYGKRIDWNKIASDLNGFRPSEVANKTLKAYNLIHQ